MLRLFRFMLSLSLVLGFVWFGTTVPIGKHNLFSHFGRIWQADETQDLVEGAKESAGPSIERFKNGLRRGLEDAQADDDAQ